MKSIFEKHFERDFLNQNQLCGTILWHSPQSISAKSSDYQIISRSYMANTAYHLKNSKKNGYIWQTLSHSKVVHNIKNFPNTTWQVSRKYVIKHQHKETIFYRVQGISPKNNSVKGGYVWRGYLKKGYNPNYTKISDVNINIMTNNEYRQFIQQASTQKLTRKILALFPKSQVTLPMSQYALGNSLAINEKNYHQISATRDMQKFLNTPNMLTDNQRLTKIREILKQYSYDGSRLNDQYEIGIVIRNFKLQHPYDTNDLLQGLVIAKK